jgi:hypothetical protein
MSRAARDVQTEAKALLVPNGNFRAGGEAAPCCLHIAAGVDAAFAIATANGDKDKSLAPRRLMRVRPTMTSCVVVFRSRGVPEDDVPRACVIITPFPQLTIGGSTDLGTLERMR